MFHRLPLPEYEMAPFPRTSEPCWQCEGRGDLMSSVRWAGEAYGELTSSHCDECGGTGRLKVDPVCPGCETPVRNDRCDICGFLFLDARHIGGGTFRVEA